MNVIFILCSSFSEPSIFLKVVPRIPPMRLKKDGRGGRAI